MTIYSTKAKIDVKKGVFKMVKIGEMIHRESQEHAGYGAGPGTIDTTTYKCPCGKGTYVTVRDNIPGFRETDYTLNCKECLENYNFDSSNGKITEKK